MMTQEERKIKQELQRRGFAIDTIKTDVHGVIAVRFADGSQSEYFPFIWKGETK